MLEGCSLNKRASYVVVLCEVEGCSVLGDLIRGQQYPSAHGSVASRDAYSIVASDWHPRSRKIGVEEWQVINGGGRESNGKQRAFIDH